MSTAADVDASPRRATRREWTGLAVIALPCIVYAMDLTVLNLALPAISTDLSPSSTQLLWIVDIYGFLVAGFLVTMGTLGDRIGRRRLLMIGATAFAVASVAAAFSRTAPMLIAMRALLGVAGATLAPSTMSLIRNMFADPRERQFAIGVWVASFSVGGAIGPLVGGVVLEWFDWGAVFLVAVPVMVLLLAVGPALLPEYRDPNAGRVDGPSVVLSLAAVLASIYGVKELASSGATWQAFASLAIGLVAGAVFIARQRTLEYPLVDLRLFRVPRFAAAISAYALACLAMMGPYIFLTQYLQLVLGLSPLAAGLVLLPWSVAFVIGSLAAPKLARHVSSVTILGCGLAAAVVGFVLMTFVGQQSGVPLTIVATLIMSLGFAPVVTVGNDMIISSAPPERAGAASALSETAAEFSGAVGIAVFGSLGMLVYRERLLAALPAETPRDILAAALETLGGALSAANALGSIGGEAVAQVAKPAFVDALRATQLLGALVLVIAAVVSTRMLRVRTDARADAGPRQGA